jgi:hypothetical protein
MVFIGYSSSRTGKCCPVIRAIHHQQGIVVSEKVKQQDTTRNDQKKPNQILSTQRTPGNVFPYPGFSWIERVNDIEPPVACRV